MKNENMNRRHFLRTVGTGALASGLALKGLPIWGEDAPVEDLLYSFVAVADPHLHQDREGELTAVQKFQLVLEHVGALVPQPDFMLLLGDIAYRRLDRLERMLPDIELPIHAIAGNQETVDDNRQLRAMFPDDFQGKDFYSFKHKGSLFIGLCNALDQDHVGHFDSEDITPAVGQCEWFQQQIAAQGDYQHTFIFGHVPPEPSNRPNVMCLAQNDSRFLHGLLKQYRPTALFFGHLHKRVWFSIGSVPVYGIRSCNWNAGGEPLGFLQVKVFRQNLELHFVDTSPE